MAVELTTWILGALGAYLALGLLCAPAFLALGVGRMDPAARTGTLGFRLLILPGVVVLWPLLLARWWRGSAHPPQERSAHRLAARSAPAEEPA